MVNLNTYTDAMMAVALSEDKVALYLSTIDKSVLANDVTFSCINSPKSVTLSGDRSAILTLQETLHENGVFARVSRSLLLITRDRWIL